MTMTPVEEFKLKAKIEITGVDLVALVKSAYALSVPVGMGMLHYVPGPLSDEDAQDIVNNPRGISMDYVYGRQVKLSVTSYGDRHFLSKTWPDHSQAQYAELLQSVGIQPPTT